MKIIPPKINDKIKEIISPTSPEIHYLFHYPEKIEKNRWIILLIFCLFSFSNAQGWLIYNIIPEETKNYYNIEKNKTYWFGNQYFVLYILFSYLGSWSISNYFKYSLYLGIILNCMGCWIRYFAGNGFLIALFGQSLCGLSQIWVLGTPAILGEKWFPKKEKLIASSLALFSNFLGNGASYIISAILSDDINLIMIISSILSTIPFILSILFLKEREEDKEKKPENLKSYILSLLHLFKNKRFLVSMICFSFCLGTICTFYALITVILEHYNLSPLVISQYGLLMILFGMFGGIIGSIFIDISENINKYLDLIIKSLISISMISLICLAIVLKQNIYCVLFYLICTGFGLVAIIPFACESLIEISFPTNESLSINTFFLIGNIYSEISSLIISEEGMKEFRIEFLSILFLFPFSYILFKFKTNFTKTKFDVLTMRKSKTNL